MPTTRPKCGKAWVASRQTRRYAVDLGAADRLPTLVDTFQTSGSGCTDAAVGHYEPSAACDGAFYVTFAGHLDQMVQGQVTRLQNSHAAGLEQHTDAQGACLVSYVDTSTHALMQVAFDGTGAFAPTVVHDVTGHLFDLYRPADGFLLDAVARGALTLDGTPAGSSTALGPAPFAGNIETPWLLPGNQQAVFRSKLLRQHDELWLADLASPGAPKRISQYLPGAGTERDVKGYAVWPDGKGLIFLQSADAAGTNVRPYAVTFAKVPATEADGPAATAFGFSDPKAPGFSAPGETLTAMSLGGNRYAAFVGDARTLDGFELYVVDRASSATVPLAPLPGPRYPAPAWSDDGKWLAYQTGAAGAVTLVDVPGRIAELAAP